jgi:hypothetical protein
MLAVLFWIDCKFTLQPIAHFYSKVQNLRKAARPNGILPVSPSVSIAKYMECGGKQSVTPLWKQGAGLYPQKRRRRCALWAYSIWWYLQDASAPDACYSGTKEALCPPTYAYDT